MAKTHNLTGQMVRYTEPSGKASFECVWKKLAGLALSKKYLAGDWTNHLSITTPLAASPSSQDADWSKPLWFRVK